MGIKDLWRKVKSEFKEVKEEDGIKYNNKVYISSHTFNIHKGRIVNSIIFNLIITIVCSVMMYYIALHMQTLQNDFKDEQNNMNGTYILYVKNNIDANSSSKLKDISHNILNTIYLEMDMDKLQKELSKNIVSDDLEKLFKSEIMNVCTVPGLDPDKNNIFICNSNGILADYSEIYASPTGTERTWEYELSLQDNKEMYQYTITQLLNQDTTDLLVEERVINNPDHVVLKSISQEGLFEIFASEGLEGLRNYTFLVPVYVMKNNDIFGVVDIKNGQRINNNKFIIVQRYSLYDYIKMYHLDAQVNEAIHYKFEHTFFMFYIFIIIYVSLSILNTIYSITLLNKVVDEQNKEYNRRAEDIDRTDFIKTRSYGRRSTDRYTAQILELAEQERKRQAEENKNSDKE